MRRAALVLAVSLAACAEQEAVDGGGDGGGVAYEVEARGTEPAGPVVEASVAVASDAAEGRSSAARAPVEGAAEILRSWERWGERALVAVYGGTQPDAGYRLRIDDVSIAETELIVSGTMLRDEPAAQVLSIPWAVVSVEADAAAAVERCTLALEGAAPISSRC